MTNKKKGVEWRVAVPDEVITEYTGIKLGAYFTHPEVMLEAQQKAREIFRELYGISTGVGPAGTCYLNVSTLGVEVIFPEDNVPMIKAPVLRDIRQVDRFELREDLARAGLMPWDIKCREYFRKALKQPEEKPHSGAAGTQGPFTTAVLVRGAPFFEDLYLYPEAAHRLLELITENSIRLIETQAKIANITDIESIGVTDDFAGLISPEQYQAFCFPYLKRIYDLFGKKGRGLHSELLKKEHLKFLPKLGVTSFDPGTDQYLSVRDIKEEIDIPFSWNIKPSGEMRQGTPESIRSKYEEAVYAGAPVIMTELCTGIPRKNVSAFVEVAREYE